MLTSSVMKFLLNNKKFEKLMKIVDLDGENLQIFWITWGKTSMKFSGKMRLLIILQVTKNQGFTLSLEYAYFEKPQGVKLTCPPLAF